MLFRIIGKFNKIRHHTNLESSYALENNFIKKSKLHKVDKDLEKTDRAKGLIAVQSVKS